MPRRRALLAAAALAAAAHAGDADRPAWTLAETLDIAPVWAGHPVGFCLLTRGDRQFAAFYDAARRMTVASRTLGADRWELTVLPQTVGWDSHNYVTMTADDDGRLHLSGNMHCVPLVYFRTAEPLNPATFGRVAAMTGEREQRCTYPRFLRGPAGELIFTYRDGSSGNGDQLYNVYQPATRGWRRLLEQPLTSGGGKMNAYLHGPVAGPDGLFHLCWVWRDHGGCESNHDLSYARSDDLVHWTDSAGRPLELPMTLGNCEVVDPVPVNGGMINGNARIGFDNRGRVVISYHKFDGNGMTQACSARLEDGTWRIYRTSDWNYRWDFRGGGSIPFEISVGSVEPLGNGRLRQAFRHPDHGSRAWLLDEATMRPLETVRVERTIPTALGRPESDIPGMQAKFCEDSGSGADPDTRYVLRWETLPPNRDRPREAGPPPPSMLRLHRLVRR